MRPKSILLLCLFCGAPESWCLRPGIPKVTWSTDHFTLTIDEKKQDLLPRLGSLAEECYAKQKAFFGYAPPGKIQMVFLDEQDYANGSAYSPQAWVVIYLHGAEHLLRGRTRWLPGVISHEIGHIFTLRKMGEDTRFLGMDLFHDWRGAGGSRFREALEWTHGRIPPWLAEGLAQYAAGVCGYDTLDTHRNMVLRVAAASGALMTLAELKGFAWDGRRDELIYAQGYSLVSHLYQTYGPKKANRYLGLAASQGWRSAFKPAFGKDLAELYADWRKPLESRSHSEDAAGEGDHLLTESPGPYAVETAPAPLKSGRFLYLSARDNDYGRTDLLLADGKGGTQTVFRNATSLQPAAEGNSALFTATRYAFLQGDVISELYRYDGESGSVERLTRGGRVIRGCESQGVVYGVRNHEGRTSVIRIVEGGFTTLYSPPDSMEITDLVPGRVPGSLTLGATSGFGGDLYELDMNTRELSPLAVSPQDERDPQWAGGTLYFSADYGGVFDVYTLAEERVTRITQVSGGAFHPVPVEDGVWFSAYGRQGFRLARAKPMGEAAPPFMVGLPVPAWQTPPLAEYEADTYDHTNLGFLGFDLALGVIRGPGYYRSGDTSLQAVEPSVSYDAGSKLMTGLGLHWKNPSEVAEAFVRLGLSKPLDYQGPAHLDGTAFELRVNAFLPSLVVGGDWNTYDFPGFQLDGTGFLYYRTILAGYAGMDWRLSEHWHASQRATVENDLYYAGDDGENVYDSEPQFGGYAELAYAHLQPGKDGVIKGFRAFAGGELPPQVNASVPAFSFTAGAVLHRSLARFLFLNGSVYQTDDWGPEPRGWVYGSASAYCAVPLGLQLGGRGGAGIFLDQFYPGVAYMGMESAALGGNSGSGYRQGYVPEGRGRRWAGENARGAGGFADPRSGYLPTGGFYDMVARSTSHEIGMTLSLKTLGFFAHPELWTAGLRFDAQDFSRHPVWSVFITL